VSLDKISGQLFLKKKPINFAPKYIGVKNFRS